MKNPLETEPDKMREMKTAILSHPQLKDYYELGYSNGIRRTEFVFVEKGHASACPEFH